MGERYEVVMQTGPSRLSIHFPTFLIESPCGEPKTILGLNLIVSYEGMVGCG